MDRKRPLGGILSVSETPEGLVGLENATRAAIDIVKAGAKVKFLNFEWTNPLTPVRVLTLMKLLSWLLR